MSDGLRHGSRTSRPLKQALGRGRLPADKILYQWGTIVASFRRASEMSFSM
jgi:hypothetical protein